jgi:hypothetical protein
MAKYIGSKVVHWIAPAARLCLKHPDIWEEPLDPPYGDPSIELSYTL